MLKNYNNNSIIIKELTEVKTMNKHDQLRKILIEAGSPEYGDIIIDEICELFDYPPTGENDDNN